MLMREIKKIDNLHIATYINSIESFPIHMHDAYEIIFVLEGSIDLKCTAFNYKLTKGDVFIVNVKELHSITRGSNNNILLVFQFDPYQYISVFPKLDYYIFVCDSFSSEDKQNEKLITLQQLLLSIYQMTDTDPIQPNAKIEDYLFKLITYLINNYQSFNLENTGYHNKSIYKNDYFQQERIFNIQEYLYKNYNCKIDLEDLANYVHLNKYYVSHLIKHATGLSMTDFLSLTRVEQSELLLLSTTKSIEQIALECGFSALRYYEKHFIKWYHTKPSDYRKNYLETVSKMSADKYYNSIDKEHLIDVLRNFTLSDFPISDNSAKVYNYILDFHADFYPFPHEWEKGLRISDTLGCMHLIPISVIMDTQKDLHFTNVELCGIFENYLSNYSLNPYLEKDLIRFIDALMSIGLTIHIVIDPYLGNYQDIITRLQTFLKNSKNNFGLHEVEKWAISIKNPTKKVGYSKKYSFIYDQVRAAISHECPNIQLTQMACPQNNEKYMYNSMHLVSHIIDQALHPQNLTIRLYQELYDISTGFNESRNTYSSYNKGLFSDLCERKPVYHAWHFLSLLGYERSLLSDNIVITKKGENFYVLVYDNRQTVESETKDINTSEIFVSLRLENLNDDSYTITKLEMDREISLFEHFANRNYSASLSSEELKYVNMASSPRISFSIAQKGFSQDILLEIKPFGAVLLIFTKK